MPHAPCLISHAPCLMPFRICQEWEGVSVPEIIMPKMGDAMTEGKVIRWYKKAGDKMAKGELVVEMESDKVNLDLEAEQEETLSELQAQEGEVVPVVGLLANILAAGETARPSK